MRVSEFYFKAVYVGEEFPESMFEEVLVADYVTESGNVGYSVLFKDGNEFGNMHDDDIEDYEDLSKHVESWEEYKKQK